MDTYEHGKQIHKLMMTQEFNEILCQLKGLLKSIAELTPDKYRDTSPSYRMLLVDLLNTIQYYNPIIFKQLEDLNLISEAGRTEEYVMDYFNGFHEGHVINAINGIFAEDDIKHALSPFIDLKVKTRLDIWDIGGGKGFWSELIAGIVKRRAKTYVLEKPHVVSLIDGLYAELNLDNSVPEHLIVLANFLHLFTLEDGIDYLNFIISQARSLSKCCILVIEPKHNAASPLPMFSYDMQTQMKIMKGISSFYKSIIPVLMPYSQHTHIGKYYYTLRMDIHTWKSEDVING